MWDDNEPWLLHDRLPHKEEKLLDAVPIRTTARAEDALVITNSERQTFLSCRQRHAFKYVQRIRSPEETAALRMGKLVHRAVQYVLEECMQHAQSAGELCGKHAVQYVQEEALHARLPLALDPGEAELAAYMVDAYIEQHVRRVIADDRLHAVEWTFKVPYPGETPFGMHEPMQYAGQVDSIWRDMQGGWVIEELKTTSQSFDSWQERMELDTQVRGYAYALGHTFHVPVDKIRVRWVVLKKTMPKEVVWLKNGTVSTDKRQLTTQAIYAVALDKQAQSGKPITEAQRAMLAQLPEHLDVCQVFEISMRQQEIVRWGQEAMADGVDLRRANERLRQYVPTRNMDVCTRAAGYCEYKQACIEGREIQDDPWIKMGIFRRADCKHEELLF